MVVDGNPAERRRKSPIISVRIRDNTSFFAVFVGHASQTALFRQCFSDSAYFHLMMIRCVSFSEHRQPDRLHKVRFCPPVIKITDKFI